MSNHSDFKFVAQKEKILTDNLGSILPEVTKRIKNGPLLPNNIRALVVGKSNCGKTNVVINLILSPHGPKFNNLFIFSKTLYQTKYKLLDDIMKGVKEVKYITSASVDDVIKPSEIPQNSLLVFDDVICSKQEAMREYFCMGRHKNSDVFYLTQCYSKTPKQLIRSNANVLIIFHIDERGQKHVFHDHVDPDLTFQTFQKMCAQCWEDPYGFVVIDLECDKQNGRYRKGFDEFIVLE